MARVDIAAKWLEENGHGPKSDRKRKRKLKRKRQSIRDNVAEMVPVFYHKLDERAHQTQRGAETQILKGRFKLDENFLRFQVLRKPHDHCDFYPFCRGGHPATVIFRGKSMSAARAVCIIANGEPGEKEVARHLCGNGHLSCINPAHLIWGSPAQNSNDHHLHHARPKYMPPISDDVRASILEDGRLPKVIAVTRNIPASIVDAIQRGLV